MSTPSSPTSPPQRPHRAPSAISDARRVPANSGLFSFFVDRPTNSFSLDSPTFTPVLSLEHLSGSGVDGAAARVDICQVQGLRAPGVCRVSCAARRALPWRRTGAELPVARTSSVSRGAPRTWRRGGTGDKTCLPAGSSPLGAVGVITCPARSRVAGLRCGRRLPRAAADWGAAPAGILCGVGRAAHGSFGPRRRRPEETDTIASALNAGVLLD